MLLAWPRIFVRGFVFLSGNFLGGGFVDLLVISVKNVVQDVIFCVVKADMLW
jgi:hypothetical protein